MANKIEAGSAHYGRPCLRLALDPGSWAGNPGVDYVDPQRFPLLSDVMEKRTVEVDRAPGC